MIAEPPSAIRISPEKLAMERAIVEGLLDGESYDEMAKRLYYSHASIGMTLLRMRDRYKVNTNIQLIAALFRSGYLT